MNALINGMMEGFGSPRRSVGRKKAVKPKHNPEIGKGGLYVQAFSGGETMWFYRTGTLKNGNASGYSVADFGRNQKPKKESIQKRDVPSAYSRGGLWKKVEEKDIPPKIMAKLKSVM
jgi:hypothetical protein